MQMYTRQLCETNENATQGAADKMEDDITVLHLFGGAVVHWLAYRLWTQQPEFESQPLLTSVASDIWAGHGSSPQPSPTQHVHYGDLICQ